jgi:histidinol-phosphatase (PHP family)
MNTIIADYHTHTRFSCDSDAAMESMCRAALERGMTEIAITDHADFEPLDACCGYFRPQPYWEAIERCRSAFNGRLTIRAGVECGEGHIYAEQIATVLTDGDYDVVLGSIHWAQGRPAFSPDFFDGLTLDEGLALYFDELARLAAGADYDILAHADIIRRAACRRFGRQTLDLGPHETRVRRVLRAAADRGKGIEVNTSYRRKGMGAPGPSTQVLRWFRDEGGEIVTLGSDGHAPEEVGADFDWALAMVQDAGFDHLATFERRRPILRRITS